MARSPALEGRGLFHNGVSIIAASALAGGLGYLFWVSCTRRVPAATIGVSVTVISALSLVALLAIAGLVPLMVRTLPGAGFDEFCGLASTALVTSATAAAVGGALGELLLPGSVQDAVGLPWLTVTMVLGSGSTAALLIFDAILQGARRADLSFARSVAASTSRLVAILIVAALGALSMGTGRVSALHAVLVIWVGSLLVSVGLAIWLLRRAVPQFKFRPERVWLIRLRRRAALEHLAALGGQLPTVALPVIAAYRLTPQQAGYVYVTWMVGSTFFMVSIGVFTALLADCAGRPSLFRRQLSRSIRLVAALLLPPATIACLLSSQLLNLFGPLYSQYGRMLLILVIISSIPDAATNLAVVMFRLQDRPSSAAALNLGMAMVALVGAWLTFPRLGVAAAGWSWLLAQVAGTLVIATMYVRRNEVIGGYRPLPATRRSVRALGRVPAATVDATSADAG